MSLTAYQNYQPGAPAGTDRNAPAPNRYHRMSWAEIVQAINWRRTYAGPWVNEMIRVRDHYNGDSVIPMPDVVGEPDSKPAVPALINLAIDGLAQRASSTTPQLFCPALDETKDTGARSLRYAEVRRRALYSTWHYSGLREFVIPRAYRAYSGYGSFSLVVRPDFHTGRARIETRDPLTTYPDLRVTDTFSTPLNVAFMTFRSRAWIKAQFSESHPEVMRAIENSQRDDSDIFDMVEWIDEAEYVVGIIGPRYYQYESSAYPSWPVGGFELRRYPNRAGIVPVAVPYRPTLDRIISAVNKTVPIVNMMARMQLLDYFAAEKHVFPDLAIVSKDGNARLVGQAWKDGRTGEINRVEGGDIKWLNTTPGPMSQQTIDQLERAGRLNSNNPAMFGGEATGNIRSGQTVNALGSYSVDPVTAEAQAIMARALSVVNEAVIATEKGYWPDKTFHHFSGWQSDRSQVVYTPSVHFETSDNVVHYPFPGTDLPSLTVAVGQLVGSGLMSKSTGRVMHPAIDNPSEEERLITSERISDALLQTIVQQASMPGGAQLVDLANIAKAVKAGSDVDDAVITAQEAAQERQAKQAPPPGPGQAASPEAQPGMAAPGGGAESVPPQIPGVPQDLTNLKDLFRTLRAK